MTVVLENTEQEKDHIVYVDENKNFTYLEVLDIIHHVRTSEDFKNEDQLIMVEWILLANAMIDKPKLKTKSKKRKPIIINHEGDE